MAYQGCPHAGFYDPKIHLAGNTVPFGGDVETCFLGLPVNTSLFCVAIEKSLVGKLSSLYEKLNSLLITSVQN